jgi:phosphoribosylaminoimidazole carboxylase
MIIGVPVATVGIDNSINAALLAVRILGAFDAEIQEKVVEYARMAKHENLNVKEIKIKELGWETYYKQMEEKK